MPTIIKEAETSPENLLDNKVTGEIDVLSEKDKVALIKHDYDLCTRVKLDYQKLKEEFEQYDVALPDKPDVVNLSEFNLIYAHAQRYATRVSNIEVQAIANQNTWSSLKHTLEEYIAEKESLYLVSEEVMQLANARQQMACVRNKLTIPYKLLGRIKREEAEAIAFTEMAQVKKKDLLNVVTNLSRQIKVLSLEQSLMRNTI